MQLPTLTDVHIRSVQDAHKLFYAVQLGRLPKIDKRLDAAERAALRPGNVYVWEERGPSSDSFRVAMERFTEGKSWTPSRVREDFLMYYEAAKKSKGEDVKSTENQVVRDGDPDQYIKQTYSVYRDDPDSQVQDKDGKKLKARKWHLNAYFTKQTEGSFRSIDDIPFLRDLVVPEGTFKSARSNKSGRKDAKATSSVQRTYAPFPSRPRRTTLPPPEMQPISQGLDPYAPGPSKATAIAIPPAPPVLPRLSQSISLPLPQTAAASMLLYGTPQLSPEELAQYTPAPLPQNFSFLQQQMSQLYVLEPQQRARGSDFSDLSSSPALSDRSSVYSSPSPARELGPHASPSPLSPSRVDPQYEVVPSTGSVEGQDRDVPCRVALAPLHSLQRSHPYRRSPVDDRALRLLGPGYR